VQSAGQLGRSPSRRGHLHDGTFPTQHQRSSVVAHQHFAIVVESIGVGGFVARVTLGADHLTEAQDVAPVGPRAGTSPKNGGVAIPNVTDGFTGAAPDIGAVIEDASISLG